MADNNKDTPKRQRVTGKLRAPGRTSMRYTIGMRFLSFVILVALLSGGVIGLVMTWNSRDYLRQQAFQNNLNQANLAAVFASNYIGAVEAHLEVFATRPDVRQAVLNGTPEQLQPTLAQLVQIQTALDSCGIYGGNGIQLINSVAGAATIGQSFADREWFQQAVATRQPYLGIPVKSRTTANAVVPFAVPIIDDQGQLRAVLTGGISLAALSDSIVNINYGSDTQAIIIDTRNGGLIIADKNPQLLLTPAEKDNEAIIQLFAGKSGAIATTPSNGEKDLIGFTTVTGLPWGVMVVTPNSTAFAILNTLTQKAIIYGVLIILASAILGGIFVLQITRPIRRLVEATREIGSGNLDFKVDTTRKNEIGDLSRAFSDMTAKLKNTMVSRDELAAEVTVRKKAEESLQAITIRQGELLAAIPDIVMEVDNNKIYTWANQAGRDFFGDAVIGKEAAFYFEGEQNTYDVVQPLFNGAAGTFYVESWQRRKDGQKRLLGWWCRVLKDNRGNVTGALSSAQDITERRQLENELKASEVRYRRLFESAKDGILIIDANTGLIVDANPYLNDILGLSLQEIKGKELWEIGTFADIVSSKERFEELQQKGYMRYEDLPLKTADGRQISVEFVSNVYEVDHRRVIQCNIRDITARKLVEGALKENEQRYRRLFEAARDGILILDVDTGTVVDVNPFMVEMLGFSREQFMDKKIWELGFLKDIVANKDNFEELKRQKYMKYENLPLETAAGQRIQVEFVSHVYEVGNQQVIQCNIRDITERRRLEEERDKFTRELAEKNTELERFTYTVSHDLKSPLVTVKTFLGYLAQDMAAADAERIAKDILFMNGAADKMNILLGELLEMSRIGRVVNPPAEVTFKELAEEAERIVAGPILEGKVKVRLIDEPVTLYGDRSRLVEIWQNLLENAVKFMGGQSTPQIDIGIEHHDKETVFFVRDNGIGIEPQYQSKLFKLFEQINPKTEGTGMGLAITKRIVELYQGRIWVESKGPGQGSCFRFTLPGALKDKEKK